MVYECSAEAVSADHPAKALDAMKGKGHGGLRPTRQRLAPGAPLRAVSYGSVRRHHPGRH
jgi:hypothetical protein